MNQIGIAVVLLVAVAGALWFRRRSLSQRQRGVFAAIAVVLLAVSLLREGPVHAGELALVVVGALVLFAAVRFLGSADRGAE